MKPRFAIFDQLLEMHDEKSDLLLPILRNGEDLYTQLVDQEFKIIGLKNIHLDPHCTTISCNEKAICSINDYAFLGVRLSSGEIITDRIANIMDTLLGLATSGNLPNHYSQFFQNPNQDIYRSGFNLEPIANLTTTERTEENGRKRTVTDMDAASEHIEVQQTELISFSQLGSTLDVIATAAAIFNNTKELIIYNNSFATLFKFDEAFLSQRPYHKEILRQLIESEIIPVHPDNKRWRDEQLEAHSAVDTIEQYLHLNDGQTIRFIYKPESYGLVWLIENVTERLALESNFKSVMQIQGATLDHLKEAIAVFGTDGKLKLFNPALEKLWKDADVKVYDGLHIADAFSKWKNFSHNNAELDKILKQVAGLNTVRENFGGQIEFSDDQVLSYSFIPLPNSQSMLTFIDVTAEAKLLIALRDRAEALEASDELKKRFLQHVSYELRAPVTSINGFCELLESEDAGALNKKQKEYLDFISSSGFVLGNIIDDLLDLSSIDAGSFRLELRNENICGTIQSALKSLDSEIEEKGIKTSFSCDEPLGMVYADHSRLTKALANIISNAIKFSHAGGKVEIYCQLEESELQISIKDYGIGISNDEQEKIFDRFYTQYPTSQSGAGLGLSISRSLIELHGGTVSVDSEPNEGTTVSIKLPLHLDTENLDKIEYNSRSVA